MTMDKERQKKMVVVGVCGSVAAVKVPELVRELVRRDLNVVVALNSSARHTIAEPVLEWASGNPVVTQLTGKMEHVKYFSVGGEAKLLLICPATADTIGKIANGIDDTPVTTMAAVALGSSVPIIVVPAMDISMYYNPFLAANVSKLKEAGVIFVEPRIAENKAKLADEESIVDAVFTALAGGGK
ncbi:Flavin prenyltransferase UbiX [uncultured archaeon]|nr:Flavin prenyltransferase UbiX [uncultured archaeon]